VLTEETIEPTPHARAETFERYLADYPIQIEEVESA